MCGKNFFHNNRNLRNKEENDPLHHIPVRCLFNDNQVGLNGISHLNENLLFSYGKKIHDGEGNEKKFLHYYFRRSLDGGDVYINRVIVIIIDSEKEQYDPLFD